MPKNTTNTTRTVESFRLTGAARAARDHLMVLLQDDKSSIYNSSLILSDAIWSEPLAEALRAKMQQTGMSLQDVLLAAIQSVSDADIPVPGSGKNGKKAAKKAR